MLISKMNTSMVTCCVEKYIPVFSKNGNIHEAHVTRLYSATQCNSRCSYMFNSFEIGAVEA